ncbi:hypothetical protein [Stutzerimonas stutzeri]|nr:hypothetical protein [Stutzerimonas stutzeri]
MDLIQSVGAELCAAAQAAVIELCRLTEDQAWHLPALAEKLVKHGERR